MRLILAEKTKAAEKIARVAGFRKRVKRGKIVYFEGREGVVFPLSGHLFDEDYPPRFKRWKMNDIMDLLESETRVVVRDRRRYQLLKQWDPDEIVVATDADREGEAIGYEAVTRIYGRRDVERLWFSSLTEEELRRAFKEPRDINVNLALAALTRRRIDLMWGAVFTRIFTLVGGSLFSAGRVQTPTLGIIVKRERERRSFVPETYYVGEIHTEKGVFRRKQKEKKKPDVGSTIVVEKVERRVKRISPPPPFRTTTLLSEASKLLGVGVKRVMEIAEELYLGGYITYPRTDNECMKKPAITPYLERRYGVKAIRSPVRGKCTEDHPPVHPVKPFNGGGLYGKLYDLIARRTLASMMGDLVVEEVTVWWKDFRAEGVVVKEKGWSTVYPVSIGKPLEVREGETLRVLKVEVKKRKTQPPSRYTQSSLIKEMERLGLGTKSTRQDIVYTLFKREYIKGRKSIYPTEKGERFYEIVERYVPPLKDHQLTKEVEDMLYDIEKGRRRPEEVVEYTRSVIKGIVKDLFERREWEAVIGGSG